MKRRPKSDRLVHERLRVPLPGFVLLTTSIFLLVGLGALVAQVATGQECSRMFFHGPGVMLLILLGVFEFSLARMVMHQFSSGERLQPAWFFLMLAGGCRLFGALTAASAAASLEIQPAGVRPDSTADALHRFGLIVGGPLQMLLLAIGLFFFLRVCRESHLPARLSGFDGGLLLVALIDAYCEISHAVNGLRAGHELSAFDGLQASGGPLLVVLLIEAILVKRYMSNLNGGLIAKCWTSITAAIFLTALRNLGLWACAAGLLPTQVADITCYISLLAATAYALGPAWQIQAIQNACGEVGVARFSPFASSLAALRLINRTN